jgi:hypothetical protein
MKCCRFLLALVLPAALALPAPAGIIFGKHKKNPNERVPQLIAAVKGDTDEGKREDAAKELRDYDSKAFPEIVPVLIDVLQHDAKPGVRAEAAQSLSKLRPVSQEVGSALEEATKDNSIRVRWQARSGLMAYRIAGYRSEPKPDEKAVTMPPTTTTAPSRVVQTPQTQRVVSPVKSTGPVLAPGETAPPPLAAPAPMVSGPRPLPVGAPQPIVTPASKLGRPTAEPDQGPDLPPGN